MNSYTIANNKASFTEAEVYVPWSAHKKCCPMTSFFGSRESKSLAILVPNSYNASNASLEAWHATGSKLHQLQCTQLQYDDKKYLKVHNSNHCEIDSTPIHQISFLGSMGSAGHPPGIAVTMGGTAVVVSHESCEVNSPLKIMDSIKLPTTCSNLIQSVIPHCMSPNSAFVLSNKDDLVLWQAGYGTSTIGSLSELCSESGNTEAKKWSCATTTNPLTLWCGHDRAQSVWKVDSRLESRGRGALFQWFTQAGCDGIEQIPDEPHIFVSSGDQVLLFDERWPSEPLSSWWQHSSVRDDKVSGDVVSHVHAHSTPSSSMLRDLDYDVVIKYNRDSDFINLHAVPHSNSAFPIEVSAATQAANELISPPNALDVSTTQTMEYPPRPLESVSLADLASPIPGVLSSKSSLVSTASLETLKKTFGGDIAPSSGVMFRAVPKTDEAHLLAGACGVLVSTLKGTEEEDGIVSSTEELEVMVLQLSMLGDLTAVHVPLSKQAEGVPPRSTHNMPSIRQRQQTMLQPSKKICVSVEVGDEASAPEAPVDEEVARTYEEQISRLLQERPQTVRELSRHLKAADNVNSSVVFSDQALISVLKKLPDVHCTRSSDIDGCVVSGEETQTSVDDLYWLEEPAVQLDELDRDGDDPMLAKLHALARTY
mmetsp:Transcript_19663/g.23387  ORF Transcript_19663/g.23387 Transcript_19663/m.23387 type:complete len:653 (-) Transcript_19663:226-2184(-)